VFFGTSIEYWLQGQEGGATARPAVAPPPPTPISSGLELSGTKRMCVERVKLKV